MRIEIVAVGTELLLGQIADTNSQWMGEHLAAAGVSSHFHQAVGDNHDRIVLAIRTVGWGPRTTTSPVRPSPR